MAHRRNYDPWIDPGILHGAIHKCILAKQGLAGESPREACEKYLSRRLPAAPQWVRDAIADDAIAAVSAAECVESGKPCPDARDIPRDTAPRSK